MKVLFVCSGNKNNGIGHVVKNQGDSLTKAGINVEYFTISRKGFWGYIKGAFNLSRHLRKNSYDIIHAHYSLSAFSSAMAFPKQPIVVSLMGSDSQMNMFWKTIIHICSAFFWREVIVKSSEMKEKTKLNEAHVIPNGVDLQKFRIIDKPEAQSNIGFGPALKNIVFIANPERKEKNYELAESAVLMLNEERVKLHTVFDQPQPKVLNYLCAADLLILTSLWEGSPNIIKEAMACNCPIVSTDVGDVKWLFDQEPGHFITSNKTEDVASKIRDCLKFIKGSARTKGRMRMIKMGLDDETIASRIITVYKKALKTS